MKAQVSSSEPTILALFKHEVEVETEDQQGGHLTPLAWSVFMTNLKEIYTSKAFELSRFSVPVLYLSLVDSKPQFQ